MSRHEAAANLQPLVLDVVHTTTYSYAGPVSLAHHLAHLQPLQDSHQQVLAFDLQVQPPPQHSQHSVDAYGNPQCHFNHTRAYPRLVVQSSSRVRVWPRFVVGAAAGRGPGLGSSALAASVALGSPAWDSLSSQLRFAVGVPHQTAVRWVQPSPHVPRLQALLAYAQSCFTPGRPVAAAALALMQQVHADFAYTSSSTTVETPLAQVLQQRRGVCQDFAHLMIGALRMLGLPARYVSGYLLTDAPGALTPDEPALLGADASHAWLQVWCPHTPGLWLPGGAAPSTSSAAPAATPTPTDAVGEWLDLDPTNNRVPGAGYVRVAIGRDFSDVTPLRGVIRGGGAHTLHVGVSTQRVASQSVEQKHHQSVVS
jgi:transglutaminase-like putative cysteine protease